MKPIETLANEHGLIRQFLDNLSMAADHIENGRRPSVAFFDKGIDFARTFAGIGKAQADYDATALDGKGQVTVCVAGQDNAPLEGSEVVANLKKALDEHDGSNVEIEVKVFMPRLISLDATVYIAPDRLWETVEPAVRASLQASFGFAKRELGQEVALSEIVDTIQDVPGVAHVQITRLAALTEDDLIDQASGASIEGLGKT